MPQPPIQPQDGPNARVAHVNVVPQSGSASFSSLYATAIMYIGTKASSMITGDCRATVAITKPSAEARLEWDGIDVFPFRDGLIARKDVYSTSGSARVLYS